MDFLVITCILVSVALLVQLRGIARASSAKRGF